MYKLYNEKKEETKKASELQTQVDNLNSTITELQGKINNMLETANSNEKIEHETSKTDSSKTNSDALYVYSSGDRNAAKGNPELLYVYEFSNDKMKFKYHAIWNNEDIEGVVTSTDGENYVYENGNVKLEFILNSMGENSIKVTEYVNNSMPSYVNLFK